MRTGDGEGGGKRQPPPPSPPSVAVRLGKRCTSRCLSVRPSVSSEGIGRSGGDTTGRAAGAAAYPAQHCLFLAAGAGEWGGGGGVGRGGTQGGGQRPSVLLEGGLGPTALLIPPVMRSSPVGAAGWFPQRHPQGPRCFLLTDMAENGGVRWGKKCHSCPWVDGKAIVPVGTEQSSRCGWRNAGCVAAPGVGSRDATKDG